MPRDQKRDFSNTGTASAAIRMLRTPPERDETPVSCRSNEVKAQFHLVQRQAGPHDQLKRCYYRCLRYRRSTVSVCPFQDSVNCRKSSEVLWSGAVRQRAVTMV